jgi:hypothetical protein
LNSRRKAKKPVTPMPKRATEVGSGVEVPPVTTPTPRVPIAPLVTPVSDAVEKPIGTVAPVVKLHTTVPADEALNFTSTSFAAISEMVTPVTPVLLVTMRLEIGSTVGVYVTSISVAVPGEVTVKTAVVVTNSLAAWLGVANATLASKPAAKVIKTERFVIEFS